MRIPIWSIVSRTAKEKPFVPKQTAIKAALCGRFFFARREVHLQWNMQANRPSYTLEEAKKKAELYCAYQERCHLEVRNKLLGMRMIPEAIDVILGHLIEEGFLNEGRFTEQFVLGKLRQKSWGRLRLQQELRQREISSFAINRGLRIIDESEYLQLFDSLCCKLWEQSKGKQHSARLHKLRDGLRYRGWEAEMIYEAIGQKMQMKK